MKKIILNISRLIWLLISILYYLKKNMHLEHSYAERILINHTQTRHKYTRMLTVIARSSIPFTVFSCLIFKFSFVYIYHFYFYYLFSDYKLIVHHKTYDMPIVKFFKNSSNFQTFHVEIWKQIFNKNKDHDLQNPYTVEINNVNLLL